MPALQARRLRLRSCSKCASHKVKTRRWKNAPPCSRRKRSGTTATKQPCCFGTCSMPASRRCCGGTRPSKREHHMLECLGRSSSEEKPSMAADPAEDAARALPLVRGVAGSRAELEQVRRSLDQDIEGRNARDGPLVRPGPVWGTRLPGRTTQITDTTLPPCRRLTILWPAEPSSRSRCVASRTQASAAPGHLPRVARSGC